MPARPASKKQKSEEGAEASPALFVVSSNLVDRLFIVPSAKGDVRSFLMILYNALSERLKSTRTMTRLIAFALVLAGCSLILPSEAHAGGGVSMGGSEPTSQFVSSTEDLPLMPGLDEDLEAGTAFDTPQGRLVEAYAVGNVSHIAILEFYATTLPQLGWVQKENNRFQRDQEQLLIEFVNNDEKGNAATTVRFALAPLQTGQ